MTVDASKLSFDSAYRYERIALKGKADFTFTTVFPGTLPTITVTHNLGYVPYVKAFYTFGSGKYFQLFAGPSSYNLDGNGVQVDNTYATTTTFVTTFFNSGVSSGSGSLYYRIYAEPQV